MIKLLIKFGIWILELTPHGTRTPLENEQLTKLWGHYDYFEKENV